MADKIAEIIESGQLQKVKEICNDEKAEALSIFNRSKYSFFRLSEPWGM